MKIQTKPNQMMRSLRDQEIIYLRKTIIQLSKSLKKHPKEVTLAVKLKTSLRRLEILLFVE